jgi:hypothetical protein
MIQIDDTGSGSLIGGTGIGVYDSSTNRYAFEVIPIKYYQNMKYYQNKAYQEQAIKIIQKILINWQISHKNSEVHICSSYVFDKVRQWLTKHKYSWKNTTIVDPLQGLVEQSFVDYLKSLGLSEFYLKHTRYAFGFHRLLQWVYADRETREKLCKTCWKSFQQWGYLEYSINNIIVENECICLKCGEIIKQGSKGQVISYQGKNYTSLFIHSNCK